MRKCNKCTGCNVNMKDQYECSTENRILSYYIY